MSYTGNRASSFSFEHDGGPRVPATLVLDVRFIKNPEGCDSKEDRRRKLLARPDVRKGLLRLAEAHLAENPDGHVAFGCRLGQDRSPIFAEELERRLASKKLDVLLGLA